MSFVSILFYLCLLPTACAFYVVPNSWRTSYLLIVSYAFYLTWDPWYALLLIGFTGLTYGAARCFPRVKAEFAKTLILWSALVPILAVLVYFKFEGHYQGILLPLGISYYTFKLISYLLETYWDHEAVERNFLDFALFPAFAPQIVSGPIQRPYDFFAQLKKLKDKSADYAQIEEGFRLILGGLMMKLLIGDRLGAFIDVVDKSPHDFVAIINLTAVICYTLQLYADFSGYTNIAIGIGKLFGIDSPPNFAAPFAATNLPDMWRRWHMSLTSWVSDYLFTPLQMAFRNLGTLGLYVCITLNMAVIGVWHGLTVNFLIFGLFHAVFMIITLATKKARDRFIKKQKWPKKFVSAFGMVLTFVLMTISLIFWHTETWKSAITHLHLVFGLIPSAGSTWKDIRSDILAPVFLCMGISLYVGAGAPGSLKLRKALDEFVPNWVQYGIYLLMISALTTQAGSKFIYGQF